MSGITTSVARRIRSGSTLPATCSPGHVFVVPDGAGSPGMYVCFTANAWTVLDSAVTGEVTGSGTTNAFPKWSNGAGSVVSDSLLTDNATTLAYNTNKFTVTAASGNVVSQGSLTTGAAGVATGSLLFKGTTSGTVTVKSADIAGTWTLTLPANDGDSGQYLQTDGSGVSSWQTVTAGITNSAANGQVAISDGTNIVGDADLTFSGDTLSATKFAGALNGTVGATTPAAGAFTTVAATSVSNPSAALTLISQAQGSVTIDNGSVIIAADNRANGTHFFGFGSYRAARDSVIGFSSSDTPSGASNDTGLSRDSAGVVAVGTGAQGSAAGSLKAANVALGVGLSVEATITAGGTTGAQTINKAAGSVNFAASATTLVVTNSLVTASSLVFCVVQTNDTTATIKNCVPGSGSFTITLTAAATAETRVGFFVVQPD